MKLRINKKTIVYVLSLPYCKTGGTELVHQLVYELNRMDIKGKVIYWQSKQYPLKINEEFRRYVDCYGELKDIVDDEDNIVIFPESKPELWSTFIRCQKVIWWMSVDNFVKKNGFLNLTKENGILRALKRCIFNGLSFSKYNIEDTYLHFYQSEYARKFLAQHGISNAEHLGDYINSVFEHISIAEKQNIILYNPKKGYKFTQELIKRIPQYEWVALENMSTIQVANALKRAKVYVDFGNHPGKDRFPREAALCECCIITGKRGSARYYEDIPIGDEYKFDETEIQQIINKIVCCVEHYEQEICNFSEYRKRIRCEHNEFINDIKRIFAIR